MAHQISLFMENRPGKLNTIIKAITDKHIAIKAFTIASADKFGIIKMLVNEPYKVRELLRDSDLTVALAEVMVIEIDNISTNMVSITELLLSKGINIDSAFGFTLSKGGKTLFVIETQETAQIKSLLEDKGVKVLSDAQIYAL
ncbi:MAG: hypothetical protein U9P80_06525 [Thermodesulfobacteriota bacterium]|nr:hypothetical protein [Thermodesulfobacteriota bacterium]